MKTLTLIRHAKSSWSDISLDDHERPLNKRGLRDAPLMAQILVEKGWKPEQLVSSTAVRALTTATYFAQALGREVTSIRQEGRIYHAPMFTLLEVIQGLEDQYSHVVLFGHNPGFTMLANHFYKGGYIDNLPTCGIVEIVGAQVDQWAKFDAQNAELRTFHFPKQYIS